MTGKFIIWGTGGFSPDNWAALYTLIKEFNVKTVLEYGCGVSTELMRAIGMQVVSLETLQEYADIPNADIRLVDYYNLPNLDRKFDLALVDGPGAHEFEVKKVAPERTLSVIHAKKYAPLMYLHDGGVKQFEILDNDPEWVKYRGADQYDVGSHDLVYIRKDYVVKR
jgi:hypothetical protein